MVNTATELGTSDDQVSRRTEAAFEVTRQALRSVLLQGRHKDELPADLDVDATVELLFTTVLGLRVRERAGHDPARLATAIAVAIRALGPTGSARRSSTVSPSTERSSRQAPSPTGSPTQTRRPIVCGAHRSGDVSTSRKARGSCAVARVFNDHQRRSLVGSPTWRTRPASLRFVADPPGKLLWISPAQPSGTHALTAAPHSLRGMGFLSCSTRES